MNDEIDIDMSALIKEGRELYRQAYEKGFKAGGEAMRESILRAAQRPAPAPPSAALVGTMSAVATAFAADLRTISRAPRGSVGRAIYAVLSESPGATIAEIEDRVERLDPEVARKSVGNELRRLEDKKYRRDRPGGYRWFLIGSQAGTENGGGPIQPDISPVHLPETEGR